MSTSRSTLAAVASMLGPTLVACVTPLSGARAGHVTDASFADSSAPVLDAGAAMTSADATSDAPRARTDDASSAPPDAGPPELDAHAPETTRDAGVAPPDAGAASVDGGSGGACAPIVFTIDAPFTATESDPIRRTDLDVADGLVFGRIDVELDFVRGPWAPAHPDGRLGMHNLFWLHRGLRGNHWLDNSVGYLNFTAATQLRLETNLGITDESVWSDVLAASRCSTVEGERYHVHYVYDAEHARWWFELSTMDGTVVCGREDVPLLHEIAGTSPYPRGASAFFIELGHIVWTPEHEGPEVATLSWTYSDVEVRFTPSSCP